MVQGTVRQRLVAWNLGVLAFVVALVIGAAIFFEARSIDAAIDRDLRDGAARTAARLEHFAHEADEHEMDDVIPGEGRELLVLGRLGDEQRTFVNRKTMPKGLPDEAAFASAFRGTAVTTEYTVDDLTLRILSVPVRRGDRVVGAVQVAKSTGEARRELARTTLALAATGGLGLLVAVPLGILLARRAMRPITDALERQRRFVADASHELRTPVAVLRARAEVIAREGGGEADRLRRDADELSALLTDLLDLARIDADQIELRREAIPLGDVVEEVAAQLDPLAKERGLTLVARPEPLFARADLARTRQVLRALVDNALSHALSSVRLEVVGVDDRACLRVSDDGPGIAAADLPRVFDRFYRADASRTRDGRGGAGLGLAIASELVARMGGQIAVESEPGKGATFTVALPLP